MSILVDQNRPFRLEYERSLTTDGIWSLLRDCGPDEGRQRGPLPTSCWTKPLFVVVRLPHLIVICHPSSGRDFASSIFLLVSVGMMTTCYAV